MPNNSESEEILRRALKRHGFSCHELRFIVSHHEIATFAWYNDAYGRHIRDLMECWGDADKMLKIQCDVCA